VRAYDPMGGTNAFSMIGDSAKTAGVGDTEDARFNTATKYILGLLQIEWVIFHDFGQFWRV